VENKAGMSNTHNRDRFHGRVGSGTKACARPGCKEPGEFRARLLKGQSNSANGPGDYQLLCLDHVREFNAGYDWFAGMSADQIAAAQSPTYAWPNETRAFSAAAGVDSPPKWADFHDPLDAISARFKDRMPKPRSDGLILSAEDRRALKTLQLSEDADRRALRKRYSDLVRKYHPDKNGGNRAYEKALQDVIAAYTHLKNTPAFT
jgi:hypothetical protein